MIHLVIPMLPPSTNHAYENIPGHGGRRLSAKGRRFKLETRVHISRNYPKELQYLKPNRPYAVLCTLYFKNLFTLGYPKKAKNRYKEIDGTNYAKLIEDALCEATGVDDSQFFPFIPLKTEGSPERTELRIWDLEEEEPFIELIAFPKQMHLATRYNIQL